MDEYLKRLIVIWSAILSAAGIGAWIYASLHSPQIALPGELRGLIIALCTGFTFSPIAISGTAAGVAKYKEIRAARAAKATNKP